MRKFDPGGFAQLKRDLEREIMGPSQSSYMDNAHRSMGALILRNILRRFLQARPTTNCRTRTVVKNQHELRFFAKKIMHRQFAKVPRK